MEKEIKVSSINLVIGKKELSLTVEEAKKLKEALDVILTEKVVYRDSIWARPYPSYPWITWCQNTGQTTELCSNGTSGSAICTVTI